MMNNEEPKIIKVEDLKKVASIVNIPNYYLSDVEFKHHQ
jgi:hypothetical protein